jgi:hypothetical protein
VRKGKVELGLVHCRQCGEKWVVDCQREKHWPHFCCCFAFAINSTHNTHSPLVYLCFRSLFVLHHLVLLTQLT